MPAESGRAPRARERLALVRTLASIELARQEAHESMTVAENWVTSVETGHRLTSAALPAAPVNLVFIHGIAGSGFGRTELSNFTQEFAVHWFSHSTSFVGVPFWHV